MLGKDVADVHQTFNIAKKEIENFVKKPDGCYIFYRGCKLRRKRNFNDDSISDFFNAKEGKEALKPKWNHVLYTQEEYNAFIKSVYKEYKNAMDKSGRQNISSEEKFQEEFRKNVSSKEFILDANFKEEINAEMKSVESTNFYEGVNLICNLHEKIVQKTRAVFEPGKEEVSILKEAIKSEDGNDPGVILRFLQKLYTPNLNFDSEGNLISETPFSDVSGDALAIFLYENDVNRPEPKNLKCDIDKICTNLRKNKLDRAIICKADHFFCVRETEKEGWVVLDSSKNGPLACQEERSKSVIDQYNKDSLLGIIIAKEKDIPNEFLSKIVQNLNKEYKK